jgi:hypothetical protein
MIRGLHVNQAQVNLGAHNMFQDYLSQGAYDHWGNLCTNNISFRITSHRNVMSILFNITRKNTVIKENIYVT